MFIDDLVAEINSKQLGINCQTYNLSTLLYADDIVLLAPSTENLQSLITESVDSVCRDTTYTQYMLIQKNLSKSQKRYTYKPL